MTQTTTQTTAAKKNTYREDVFGHVVYVSHKMAKNGRTHLYGFKVSDKNINDGKPVWYNATASTDKFIQRYDAIRPGSLVSIMLDKDNKRFPNSALVVGDRSSKAFREKKTTAKQAAPVKPAPAANVTMPDGQVVPPVAPQKAETATKAVDLDPADLPF